MKLRIHPIFLLVFFLFGFNITTIAQDIVVGTPSGMGYDDGELGTGYDLGYELSTPNKPRTYLLQHVTAHIIYHCGEDIVLERKIDYYEWFMTGNNCKTEIDKHYWFYDRETTMKFLKDHKCLGKGCNPMTAKVTQKFILGIADDSKLKNPLEPLKTYSNGAKFGYLEGGTDSLFFRNCEKDTAISNPTQEEFVKGKADEYGGKFGLSFKNTAELQGVTHSTTIIDKSGSRKNISAKPGEGHNDNETYKKIADIPDDNSYRKGTNNNQLIDYAKILKAISTGKTTGHIATLTVTNPTDDLVNFKPAPAIIPSKEFETIEGLQKSQPQIYTGNIEQEIAPGETVEIPVEGYCLDVGKPPVPAGFEMPEIEEWITQAVIQTELPPNYIAAKEGPRDVPPPDPFNPPNKSILTYPGTDEEFKYNINISEHPEDAAKIIFPLVENITTTYDSLQQNGEIQTPFSSDEDRQREAVIQQSIWMATSLLQGQKYGKEEFTGRMEDQFEETSGIKIDDATEQQKEQFNQGIDQFWGAFELVGEKAKVIKKKEQEIKGGEEEENNCCDRIRSRLHGTLLLPLNNAQYVEINGNKVKFSVNKDGEWINEELNFGFDIQAAFCSLGDNQVLERLTRSQISTHTIDEDGETVEIEGIEAEDVIMGSPTGQQGSRDAYVMRILKQLFNGKEISITVSIDKNTCEVMVQVIVDGAFFEHSYTPRE